jgi:carboxypeptidase Q
VTRSALALALVLAACGNARNAPTAPTIVVDERLVASATLAADRIEAASAREPDVAWTRLRELTRDIGHRISGSAALDRAIAWAERRMRDDRLDDVRRDPVMVPHWVRGAEHGAIVRPIRRRLALLALGGSVGTTGTLRGRVVAFDSFDAL